MLEIVKFYTAVKCCYFVIGDVNNIVLLGLILFVIAVKLILLIILETLFLLIIPRKHCHIMTLGQVVHTHTNARVHSQLL